MEPRIIKLLVTTHAGTVTFTEPERGKIVKGIDSLGEVVYQFTNSKKEVTSEVIGRWVYQVTYGF